MKKIILIILTCFIIAIFGGWIFSLITGYTFVYIPYKGIPKAKQYAKNEVIPVLEELNFNDGKWDAYLSFSRLDLKELEGIIPKRTCLKLSDIRILMKMKKDWNMVFTGGDIATAESCIFFTKNGEVVFRSEIVVNKYSEGLQSPAFGWIEPVKPGIIMQYCKEFNPVYWPIVILK
jgi:hypothetical protein